MSKFISWLKRQARKWCAPGYQELWDKHANLGAALCASQAEVKKWMDKLSDEIGHSSCLQTRLEVAEIELMAMKNSKVPSGFPVVMADDAPKWEGPDAERWRHFLTSTETGQKIQALANWHEQNANRAAVLRSSGAENNTGFARGWHNATAYFFQTLSAPVPPQTDQEDKQSRDGASELLERVAP